MIVLRTFRFISIPLTKLGVFKVLFYRLILTDRGHTDANILAFPSTFVYTYQHKGS